MPLSSSGGGAALDTIQTINSATSTTATAWGSFIDTTFTAPSQTLTLPAIAAADVGNSITVFNRGTNAFTLAIASGTLTSQIGTTINVGTTVIIKAVSVTSAVVAGTNAAQGVATEYVEVMYNNTNTTNITSTDHVKYNTVLLQLGTSITLDISTPYTSALNVNSLGRFLLQPGKTYELEGDIGDVGGGAGYAIYKWYNADTGVVINDGTGGSNIVGANLSNTDEGRNLAKTTFTPTIATRVELRITNFTSLLGYGGQFAAGRATARIQAISGLTPIAGSVAPATAGDIKFSGLSFDHGGDWILLNGRLKSSLTPSQQVAATNLGYGVNIPDMRGRMAVGAGGTLAAAVNSTGGSLAIPQNALPNVTLGGSTGTDPGHTHIQNERYTPNSKPASGQPNWGGDPGAASIYSSNSTGSAGSHSHALTTSSINGGVVQQNFISPYFANNWFVWLGSSASVTTLASPMVGANGVTGGASGTVPAPAITDNVNFLRGDGTWAVPSPAAAIVQTFTASGTYTPTAGMKYCIVEAVGGGGGGGATTPCTAGNVCVGSGGGSGAYVKVLLTAAQIGASKSVTIGAGGVSGGAGGATAMTGILAASGGGSGASNAPSIFNGRSGGLGGSGSVSIGMTMINKDGEQGLGSFGYVSGTSQVTQQGGGGDSMMGVGAITFNQGSTGTQSGSGSSALANTGGGGGGAIAAQGVASSNTGGVGGSGNMKITEYF
jgi:hypothetical protein